MRKVDWSIRATENLAKQLAFIAADNEFNAARVRERVTEAVMHLAEAATGRKGRMDETFEKFVPKTSLIIVYALPDKEKLTVVRVIHAAGDFKKDRWPEGE